MARTVWKFEVPVDDDWHEIELPAPAKIVHVGTQPGGMPGYRKITFWAEVDPSSQQTYRRKFRIYGTGHTISGQHVGSTFDGPFVWHLYAEPVYTHFTTAKP